MDAGLKNYHGFHLINGSKTILATFILKRLHSPLRLCPPFGGPRAWMPETSVGTKQDVWEILYGVSPAVFL